jgi:hypothetical protein
VFAYFGRIQNLKDVEDRKVRVGWLKSEGGS